MTNELKKIELRFNELNMESTDEGLVVSGYVNKTNEWSQPLGVRKKFVERILPGTFTRALQNGNEVNFLAEHDNSKILASTRNGSLTLREDEQGLFMSATIAPTSWGKDYHTLIKEGIIRNMSFGMKVVKDSWKKIENGLYERSISDIYLAEVSAVRNPAYAQSTIAARSIEVIEDVEIPKTTENKEEKREVTTLEQKLEVKRSHLKAYEKMALLVDGTEFTNEINNLKGEIRRMESQLKIQSINSVVGSQEDRAMTTDKTTSTYTSTGAIRETPMLVPTSLIKEKAKKMNGKHSLVARTKLVVQSGSVYETFLQDAKNRKENLFKGELDDLTMSDYTGTKVRIETERIGTAMEMSELLLEQSPLEEQEQTCEDTLRNDIEDSINYAMLTGDGNMESLNVDTSVSQISLTAEVGKISLVDVFEIEASLNHAYREGAEFIMHTSTFKKLRTDPEFKDHIELAVDEVTGKKLYHLIGYPILINDNADVNRIIFGNLFEGYTTVVSDGKKHVTQDLAGRPINKTYYSFDLQKTADTNRAMKGTKVYLMDAYLGGKVINKDCFVRIDVKMA